VGRGGELEQGGGGGGRGVGGGGGVGKREVFWWFGHGVAVIKE